MPTYAISRVFLAIKSIRKQCLRNNLELKKPISFEYVQEEPPDSGEN